MLIIFSATRLYVSFYDTDKNSKTIIEINCNFIIAKKKTFYLSFIALYWGVSLQDGLDSIMVVFVISDS